MSLERFIILIKEGTEGCILQGHVLLGYLNVLIIKYLGRII